MLGIDAFSRSRMRISFAVQDADSWFDRSLPLLRQGAVKLLRNVQEAMNVSRSLRHGRPLPSRLEWCELVYAGAEWV
jgi:hypothetical protein